MAAIINSPVAPATTSSAGDYALEKPSDEELRIWSARLAMRDMRIMYVDKMLSGCVCVVASPVAIESRHGEPMLTCGSCGPTCQRCHELAEREEGGHEDCDCCRGCSIPGHQIDESESEAESEAGSEAEK